MGFIDDIKARAKTSKKTIVLPETEDIRTYEAAEAVLKEGTANLILVGSEEEIAKNKGSFDISGATIVDPAKSEKTDAYIAKLVELREKKGMTEEKARELLLTNYLYYGVMMVKMKDADGMVSGACHSTADTLRPSLRQKTKPGTKLVSAFFIMVVPDCEMGANGTFLFGDSGLEQNPDPEKLAAIALSSADSFRLLTEKEPVVALLSHSTKGSAKHADVDKVVEATKIAKENAPEGLLIDGEFQLDAAIVPSVGASKAPGSPVAGKANVLIFPDLDAGNIGYKLVQRLAKAEAYGPLTQGIAAPVNDLSRGCSAKDIEGVIAITAVQAMAEDK